MSTVDAVCYHKSVAPLAQWLLKQYARDDAIGALAKAAKADPGFPRNGDFTAISKRLNELQADGDVHAALEDADIEAACY